MRRFKILLVAVSCLIILAVMDYAAVQYKDSHVSRIVSNLGGKTGSIPAWPLGTEYRISFESPLTMEQINFLTPLNDLRGDVWVAFPECAFSENEVRDIRSKLYRCHLHSITEDNSLVPLASCSD